MQTDKLLTYIESLIFVADIPVTLDKIRQSINNYLNTKLKDEEIASKVDLLIEKYEDESYSFGIKEIAGGYCFMTKGAYHELNGEVLKRENQKKLSRAALETLSIIAYKQPITKGEIESIRGVSSDYSVQKLMEKELVEMIGRAETLGKPLLYATSEKFMNYFGLKSINELPKLKELKVEEDFGRGEQASDTESE